MKVRSYLISDGVDLCLYAGIKSRYFIIGFGRIRGRKKEGEKKMVIIVTTPF